MVLQAHTLFVIFVSLPGVETFRGDLKSSKSDYKSAVDVSSEHIALAAARNSESTHSSKDVSQIAQQTLDRVCVDRLGRDYEVILQAEFPQFLPNQTGCATNHNADIKSEHDEINCETLPDLLARLWTIEDSIKKDTGKKKSLLSRLSEKDTGKKENLRIIRANIKQRHFSVKRAFSLCAAWREKPHPRAMKECLLEHLAERRTIKHRRLIRERNISINISATAAAELKASIEKELQLEGQVQLLNDVVSASSRLYKKSLDSLKNAKEGQVALLKQRIKAGGFPLTEFRAHCKKETKHSTPGHSAAVLARIVGELRNATVKVGEQCEESTDLFCPEGTVADSRRAFDAKTFAATYSTGFAIYKPTAMAVGGLVGLMVAGPAGAAAGATAAAVPGPGFVVPIPIATAVAADWLPKCRCYPSNCAFDEELGYCKMSSGGRSKNPFDWLPYPGQRCLLKNTSKSKKKCVLKPCAHDDFSAALPGQHNVGFSGRVGYQAGTQDTYNCLSIIGDSPQPLLSALELPDSSGNTLANRVALYQKIGVKLERSEMEVFPNTSVSTTPQTEAAASAALLTEREHLASKSDVHLRSSAVQATTVSKSVALQRHLDEIASRSLAVGLTSKFPQWLPLVFWMLLSSIIYDHGV